MKIGVVINRLEPARGGAEVYTSDFVRWLLQSGHDVTVVAARWNAALEAECRKLRGRVKFERINAGWGLHVLRSVRFAEAAERRVAGLKAAGEIDVALDMGAGLGCEVVQPHAGVREVAVEGTLDSIANPTARALKRFILRWDPTERIKRRLQARRYRHRTPPQIIAVSKLVGDSVKKVHAVPDERIHIIHNGVNLDRFSPTRLSSFRRAGRELLGGRGEVIVLTVAHNLRLKGTATVIALARRAEKFGLPFRFVVLGAGARKSRPFEKMARRSGVSTVRFIPATDDVDSFYAGADVFLLPTFYDSCALTTFEALASGLPVITTARNGASERITHGAGAFVIPEALDLDGFMAALTKLADPETRRQMAVDARSAAENLGCEVNYRRVLEVLHAAARPRDATLAFPFPVSR